MKKISKETISKIMSSLAKLSHKKSPRSKEWYKEFQRKALVARRKKLSTGKDIDSTAKKV